MDKAGFSGKPKGSARSVEDIPEALRDSLDTKTRSRTNPAFLIGGLVVLGAIALGAGSWYVASALRRDAGSKAAIASSSNPAKIQPMPEANPSSSSDTLLGHFPYTEAPLNELQPIVIDGHIKLRKAAAKQFRAMEAAARASGILLVPISGFRSIKDQQHLFFDIKAQRGETTTKRAEVSAPPGYSEHHTGYAVDVGDGAVPATNLSPNFDQTRAFKWLSANAAYFSFEMSFPKNNPQGVSYEPWHWRFVGDQQSLESFYRAKNLKSSSTP